MTSPNFETFQGQFGGPDAGTAGAGAPPQQDATMGGQLPDNSQGQYQGGNGGDPGSAGGQPQGTDAKTTLWYVVVSHRQSSAGPSLLNALREPSEAVPKFAPMSIVRIR